jgi:hypothetical protein
MPVHAAGKGVSKRSRLMGPMRVNDHDIDIRLNAVEKMTAISVEIFVFFIGVTLAIAWISVVAILRVRMWMKSL